MPLSTNSIPAMYNVQIAYDCVGKPVYARTDFAHFNAEVDKVLLNGAIILWQSLITFDPDVRLV